MKHLNFILENKKDYISDIFNFIHQVEPLSFPDNHKDDLNKERYLPSSNDRDISRYDLSFSLVSVEQIDIDTLK